MSSHPQKPLSISLGVHVRFCCLIISYPLSIFYGNSYVMNPGRMSMLPHQVLEREFFFACFVWQAGQRSTKWRVAFLLDNCWKKSRIDGSAILGGISRNQKKGCSEERRCLTQRRCSFHGWWECIHRDGFYSLLPSSLNYKQCDNLFKWVALGWIMQIPYSGSEGLWYDLVLSMLLDLMLLRLPGSSALWMHAAAVFPHALDDGCRSSWQWVHSQ